MPINFIQDIAEDKFLFSHNNNVIQYYSDTTGANILRSEITVNGVVVKLYPSPILGFYYNMKSLISVLINRTNYIDDLETDLTVSYAYEWQKHLYINADVEIKIFFDNDTEESVTRDLHFILTAMDLVEYNSRYPVLYPLDELKLFQPLVSGSNNRHYAKYFFGFPFDISVYIGFNNTTGTDLLNTTNGTSFNVPTVSENGFERIVFCDGRTDISLDSNIPMVNGTNNIEISATGMSTKYLSLDFEKTICGEVYLKWLNSDGGFSYWLFKNSETQRNFDNIGYLQNDFNNLESTVSPVTSMGINSDDLYSVYEELMTEEKKNLVQTMLDSPKVYMFTGTPFSQNTFNDWVEVKLNQSDFIIKQLRRNLYNVNINFTLPKNNTIKL